MTINVESYFKKRCDDRKKEPRYLAMINKDSCTSCNACATVCPVDCIYEVPGSSPSESYHQIDTTRCIGCQFCYRIPSESTSRYTLELCPWNAIDLIHNPNLNSNGEASPLQFYYRGEHDDMPWQKLEEYGYQLFLDGEVYLPAQRDDLEAVMDQFCSDTWYLDEEQHCRVVGYVRSVDGSVCYRATDNGRAILNAAFDNYSQIFLD